MLAAKPTPAAQPDAAAPSSPPLFLLVGDPPALAEAVAPMRGGDVAEALNAMSPESAAKVIAALPFDVAVEVLNEPDLEHRHTIVEGMERGSAAALVSSLSPDRRADLLRDLPAAKRAAVLSTIEQPLRGELEELLRYAPHTAGGIMTTEVVTVAASATVADAIAGIRTLAKRRELAYSVYVVDPVDGKLLRAVTLQDLLLADPTASIANVGDRRPPLSVTAGTNQEEVARYIAKYNLLALPVVDERGRPLGIATVDDVIDAMVKETTEDVQKLGGSEALDEPYLKASFLAMMRKRAGWLSALFLGEMLTATAMGFFEGEIQRAVVLSLFVPLIISSGGNSGSQATSLIIRAMALREVRLRDWWRVVARELPTGLALGATLGVIGIMRIILWQHLGFYDYKSHYLLIALTIGVALVGVVTFGTLAGSMLPFVLRRLGFDPASASAPFVATLVDVTGLVIYFSVAYVILQGTLL